MIKLEPQDYETSLRQMHRDDNNRFNPEDEVGSCGAGSSSPTTPTAMVLMEQRDGLPDPETEVRLPLHRGSQFVVDTQRLWHVVSHPGDAPRTR